MRDLIGDIHGHADALERVLVRLGYARQHCIYRHPDRQAIFLGDLLDLGPKSRETLAFARPAIDSGAVLSALGNHEHNSLIHRTPDREKPGRVSPATRRQEHLRASRDAAADSGR